MIFFSPLKLWMIFKSRNVFTEHLTICVAQYVAWNILCSFNLSLTCCFQFGISSLQDHGKMTMTPILGKMMIAWVMQGVDVEIYQKKLSASWKPGFMNIATMHTHQTRKRCIYHLLQIWLYCKCATGSLMPVAEFCQKW